MPSRSPQQIEASRQNGRKSRGPKTPEGKNQSRLNALKHGLAARVVLPPDDLAALPALIDAWRARYTPRDVGDDLQILLAAHASSRLLRVIEQEQQAYAERLADAEQRCADQQARRLAELKARLAADPIAVNLELEQFPAGLAWKRRELAHLRDSLKQYGRFNYEEVLQVLRLTGIPTDPSCPDRDRFFLIGDHLQAGGERHPLLRQFCSLGLPPDQDTPAARAEAIAEIVAFLNFHLDRLETLQPAAAERLNQAQAAARREALLDTSPAGILRLRYERAAVSDLRHAQAHLDRRAAAAAAADETAATPKPASTPAPAPAEAPPASSATRPGTSPRGAPPPPTKRTREPAAPPPSHPPSPPRTTALGEPKPPEAAQS